MLRRVVHLLAIWGLLVHAGLIVRHNTMMVAAAHAADLATDHATDLATAAADVICHNDDAGALAVTDEGAPRDDNKAAAKCPICLGLVSAVAVLADDAPDLSRPDAVSIRNAIVGEAIHVRRPAMLPPPRGPPATA